MLDLDRGVAAVRYTIDDVVYTREVFVSQPDQVLVVRLTASRPGALAFTARLGSRSISGPWPGTTSWSFAARLRRTSTRITTASPTPSFMPPTERWRGDELRMPPSRDSPTSGSSHRDRTMTLRSSMPAPSRCCFRLPPVLTVLTGRPGRDGMDPAPIAAEALAAAADKPYEISCTITLKIISGSFAGSSLDLGSSPEDARKLPTDQRVRHLAPMIRAWWRCTAQYGRYLLIASSRPGHSASQPSGDLERRGVALRGAATTRSISIPK